MRQYPPGGPPPLGARDVGIRQRDQTPIRIRSRAPLDCP